MISKTQIFSLPKADWISQSDKELIAFAGGQKMVDASSPVMAYWKDELLLVSGLYRPSLVGIPYLWALLARGIERATTPDLRFLRRELEQYAPFQTLIERNNIKTDRFARIMGLSPEGRYMIINGTEYEVYGRSAWHS